MVYIIVILILLLMSSIFVNIKFGKQLMNIEDNSDHFMEVAEKLYIDLENYVGKHDILTLDESGIVKNFIKKIRKSNDIILHGVNNLTIEEKEYKQKISFDEENNKTTTSISGVIN